MLPPELNEPFKDATERGLARQQLLDYYSRLEEVRQLAVLPSELWEPEQAERFPTSASGHSEHPAERLRRWRALFTEELRHLKMARDAAVHERIPDVELRTADYLARRLLAAAYGRGIEEVNNL